MTVQGDTFRGVVPSPSLAAAGKRVMRGVVALMAAVLLSAPLRASLMQVNIGVIEYYAQGSTAPPVSPTGFQLLFSYTQNPGEFTSASVTYTGAGSPQTLPTAGSTPVFLSPAFSTLAAFQSAYPLGVYTFNLSGSSTMATESDNYSQNLFPAAIPAFAAATFTGLQNLNPAAPFTANFNAFTPNPSISNPNASTRFGFNDSSGLVWDSGVLPDTATSFTLPAGTLKPNSQYTAFVQFHNDFETKDNSTGTFVSQGFNEYALVYFTTAAATPEPSTLSLFGLAACLAGFRLWQPRARVSGTL